jgi:hypothetical protein
MPKIAEEYRRKVEACRRLADMCPEVEAEGALDATV